METETDTTRGDTDGICRLRQLMLKMVVIGTWRVTPGMMM